MPIPVLEKSGFLAPGVHECTLAEIRVRFGSFQGTSRRPDLFDKLEAFIVAARSAGIVRSLVVDGSFVTAEAGCSAASG